MLRTLIVDNSGTFKRAFRESLYSRFPLMVIDEAGDTKEALKKVKDFKPDLMFMDINLPVKSGFKLIKRIKHSYPKVIIIVLTSTDSSEYRKAASQKGADYFISKTTSTAEEVFDLIESILSGPEPTNEGHRNSP
jgi:DNA-binding NarL/FixJ family response regulator